MQKSGSGEVRSPRRIYADASRSRKESMGVFFTLKTERLPPRFAQTIGRLRNDTSLKQLSSFARFGR